MSRSETEPTRNPPEDPQRNAADNAKAPLQDRPVSHPDHPIVDAPEAADGARKGGEDTSPPDPAASGAAPVRDAGPAEMDLPPKRWTRTDEESDASFPASDPPGNY